MLGKFASQAVTWLLLPLTVVAVSDLHAAEAGKLPTDAVS